MKTTITNAIRTLLVASVLTVGFGLMPLSMAHAGTLNTPSSSGYGLDKVKGSALVGTDQGAVDPYKTVVTIINYVLSFLGIIAVIIILLAGFKWMTARGDDKKVAEAQKMLIQGVIGLAIILSAWAIAQWAFTVPSTIVSQ